MASYEGDAELHTDAGEVIGPVSASLQTLAPEPGGVMNPKWGGTISGAGAILSAAFASSDLQIRLPNGRAGQIIVTALHKPWKRPEPSVPVIESGPRPFDKPPPCDARDHGHRPNNARFS